MVWNDVEVFYHSHILNVLFFLDVKFPFRENSNTVVFSFPFHIFMPLANLWFISLQGSFPILMTSCPDFYVLIRSPSSLSVISIGRILIPGFICSPPTLAVVDVTHYIPLGNVGRDFPFTEDTTLYLVQINVLPHRFLSSSVSSLLSMILFMICL
jgi:hypothetical protein